MLGQAFIFRGGYKDKLPANRRKALTSLKNHWDGLTVFVNHPEVPMDNNQAERNFRDVARFRQNCYGVFSEKFAVITAAMFTIFATFVITINITTENSEINPPTLFFSSGFASTETTKRVILTMPVGNYAPCLTNF